MPKTLSLPVRLTIVYTVAWSLVLVVLLFAFRAVLLEAETANTAKLLAADWGALKGYLRIERGRPNWYYDEDDSVEKGTTARLRKAFLVVDSNGRLIERSPLADSFSDLKPGNIAASLRAAQDNSATFSTSVEDSNGSRYHMQCGEVLEEAGRELRPYYACIGLPAAVSEPAMVRLFQNRFFLLLVAAGLGALLSGVTVRHCTRAMSTAG